jgi:nitric-oxide synthase
VDRSTPSVRSDRHPGSLPSVVQLPRCPVTGASASPATATVRPATTPASLGEQAESFVRQVAAERGAPLHPARLARVRHELEHSGTYWHTSAELTHGARMAWRNSARCIGRLHWETLEVRDLRHLTSAEDVFAALLDHLLWSTNGGKIRPLISIFAPAQPGQRGIRIWNPQLVRYAGYRQADGTVIGDPATIELTEVLHRLGWRSGQRTPFDVLPLAIEMPGQAPRVFELPRQAVLEVPLSHPDYPWFAALDLRWYALPAISDMALEMGGVMYTAAPFSGWYMVTEVGARDLGDSGRYNLLPLIAEGMGLDTRVDRSLWRDRAIVELNVAVLHSFARHGVSMVDHHTAARQFVRHLDREQHAGRQTPAQWSWIVPPISGSTTSVFSRALKNFRATPNYIAQSPAWRDAVHGSPQLEARCPLEATG